MLVSSGRSRLGPDWEKKHNWNLEQLVVVKLLCRDHKQTAPRPTTSPPSPHQLVVGLKSFVPESEASERLSQGITGEGELSKVQLARNYPNQGKNIFHLKLIQKGVVAFYKI